VGRRIFLTSAGCINTVADGDITFALSLGEFEADVNVLGVAAADAMAGSICVP